MSRTISIHQNLQTHVLALSISCLLLIGCRRPCGGSHTIKHTIWWLQFILGSLPNCTTHDPITHHFKLTHGQPKNQTKPTSTTFSTTVRVEKRKERRDHWDLDWSLRHPHRSSSHRICCVDEDGPRFFVCTCLEAVRTECVGGDKSLRVQIQHGDL